MTFEDIAAELIFIIFDAIDHGWEGTQARVRLTATCKRLRKMLLPQAFETVRFSNDKRISDSALVAARNHGIHIKKLHFLGLDPLLEGAGNPGEYVENRTHTLPHSALILFEAKRSLLPCLRTVIVEFDHNFDDYPDRWTDPTYGMGISDSNGASEAAFWELWDHTYFALSSNLTVPHVIISNWTPQLMLSHREEDRWHAFLARLEKFELTIADSISVMKHGPRGRPLLISSNAECGYEMREMDRAFFDHLSGVKTLKFSGSRRLFVGSLILGSWRNSVSFPIETDALESLISVELSRIFISADLIQFIRRYRGTLRSVVLKDVVAFAVFSRATNEYNSIALPWCYFFRALRETQGLALTNFQVESICPLDLQEAKAQIKRDVFGDLDVADDDIANDFGDGTHPTMAQVEEERVAASRIRMELNHTENKHRDLKLFGYAELDWRTGFPRLHATLNRLRFEEGQDQAAYEEFMNKLGLNGGRIRR
ncbi:hypothetical protein V8F20_010206 [Naviculisporaceae sp. PSN 640]